jgi:endoglycosylceramidase
VPTLEPLAIHADAEWIRDAQDRIVILRGANYSGLEFGNFIGNPNGPEEADFAQMASWGLNVVRLPFAWSYLEPAPNQFADSHLHEEVDPVVEFAARHDLLVVLEMHQFFWSPCFTNGNGAPAWVCEGHNYSNDFRGAIDAGCAFIAGVAAPDGRTQLDHFVDVWGLVAHHFAGDARVGGINFLNEPHSFGCPTPADIATHELYELYRRLRSAVRAEGAMQTIFIDPPVARNLGIAIPTEALGPDVVYAPHLYTQTFGLPELEYDGNAATITADYELATSEAQGFGGPLWPGEFGGNTNAEGGFRDATELFYRDVFAELDRRLIGGAIWAYFPSDNTFSVVDRDGNEKGDLVNILARPYARRVAGVPTEMRFDVDTKEFVFSWRVDGVAPGGGITEVFVPERHYPNGFDAELPAGVTLHPGPEGQIVLVVAPAAGEYTVRLRPR